MLVIDPANRISVIDALNHSYVNLWYDSDEVNAQPIINYDKDMETKLQSVDGWKRNLKFLILNNF